jgi:hypothetical protein
VGLGVDMSNSSFNYTVLYIRQLAIGMLSVWFIGWAIRRRYDLDCKLTTVEQVVRWLIIVLCFVFALLQGQDFRYVRIASGILAMILIAWPSLIHRLAISFSRSRDV